MDRGCAPPPHRTAAQTAAGAGHEPRSRFALCWVVPRHSNRQHPRLSYYSRRAVRRPQCRRAPTRARGHLFYHHAVRMSNAPPPHLSPPPLRRTPHLVHPSRTSRAPPWTALVLPAEPARHPKAGPVGWARRTASAQGNDDICVFEIPLLEPTPSGGVARGAGSRITALSCATGDRKPPTPRVCS